MLIVNTYYAESHWYQTVTTLTQIRLVVLSAEGSGFLSSLDAELSVRSSLMCDIDGQVDGIKRYLGVDSKTGMCCLKKCVRGSGPLTELCVEMWKQ